MSKRILSRLSKLESSILGEGVLVVTQPSWAGQSKSTKDRITLHAGGKTYRWGEWPSAYIHVRTEAFNRAIDKEKREEANRIARWPGYKPGRDIADELREVQAILDAS